MDIITSYLVIKILIKNKKNELSQSFKLNQNNFTYDKKGGENKIKNKNAKLFLGISLALVMIIGSTPLVFSEEIDIFDLNTKIIDGNFYPQSVNPYSQYQPNQQFDYLWGFPILEDGEITFIKSVDINNYRELFFNSTTTEYQTAKSSIQQNNDVFLINTDSKFPVSQQTELYLINELLSKHLTEKELNEKLVRITFSINDYSKLSVPDYVQLSEPRPTDDDLINKVEEKSKELADFLRDKNEQRLLKHYGHVPINKIHDLAEIFDADDNIIKLTVKLTINPYAVRNASDGTDTSNLENNHNVFEFANFIPPLQQVKNGVPPSNVSCNENKVLALKNNGSPICVTLQSLEKLIELNFVRG